MSRPRCYIFSMPDHPRRGVGRASSRRPGAASLRWVSDGPQLLVIDGADNSRQQRYDMPWRFNE
jgi:hypothetical protein